MNYNNNLFGVHKANIGLVSKKVHFSLSTMNWTEEFCIEMKCSVPNRKEVKVCYIFDSKAEIFIFPFSCTVLGHHFQ